MVELDKKPARTLREAAAVIENIGVEAEPAASDEVFKKTISDR
jgi:hypothetical protein